MADERGTAVRPPYICNWCGEKLHDRYQKHIYIDSDGRQYCSAWCRDRGFLYYTDWYGYFSTTKKIKSKR